MTGVPADLTADTARRRAEYLTEVLPLLYPAPCTTTPPRSSAPDTDLPVYREFVVLPGVSRARLLAPIGNTRITIGAVRRYSEPVSTASRLKRHAVVAAVRTGADRILLRDRVRIHAPDGADHIERFLRHLLGQRFDLSVHIGPARANRKPVLQLLDDRGHTTAFVKLGINELTRALVRSEAQAMLTLADAGFHNLRVPTMLASGQWRGHEVLVTSALPVEQPRTPLDESRLAAAMREVSAVSGIRSQRLTDSRYWSILRGRLSEITDTEDGRTLAAAGHDLMRWAGDRHLQFGTWHGDWTPWNMAVVGDGLLVWDWERFTTGVPVGFDPLHYLLQNSIMQEGRDPRTAVVGCLAAAPALLADFGVAQHAAHLTALLYLIDLATRYLTDKQTEAGARLGVLGTWLLPELLAAIGRLAVPGTAATD